MKIEISLLSSPPDREEFTSFLKDYYGYMASHLKSIGGPTASADGVIAEFWEEAEKFLPPSGALLEARDERGKLVGTAAAKLVGDGRMEFKRLFVTPETRGTGLGRRLAEWLVDHARNSGAKTALIDTFRDNKAVLGLLADLGFETIDCYDESATMGLLPELAPYLVFAELDLQSSKERS